MFRQNRLDRITEYQESQCEYDGNQKNQRIEHGAKPDEQIIVSFVIAIDRVHTPLQAENPLRSTPDRQDNGYRDDRGSGRGKNLIDADSGHLSYLLRHVLKNCLESLPLVAGQEELDHGCQSNGKGTERNHKKKGGLSSVYSYLVFAEAPGNAENQLTYLFQSETSCLALTMVS